MVKHVILWTLKDELSADEKVSIKQGIKEGLESLKGKVPGIVDIKVNINGLASSNADLMLDPKDKKPGYIPGVKNVIMSPAPRQACPLHIAQAAETLRPFFFLIIPKIARLTIVMIYGIGDARLESTPTEENLIPRA